MNATQLRVGLVGPLPPPNGGMAMQMQQLAVLLSLENIHVEKLATNPPYRPAWVGRVQGLRAVFRLVPYLWSVWRLAGRVEALEVEIELLREEIRLMKDRFQTNDEE